MSPTYYYVEELLKLSEDRYREVAGSSKRVLADIPVVDHLSRDNETAIRQIKRALSRKKGQDILGHRNVVIPENVMGDVGSLGFKPTRLAVPLPGEPVGATTWRRGDLHLHKMGPLYFAHQDKTVPKGLVATLRHGIVEGTPALRKRFREKAELVRDNVVQ